MLFDNSVFFNTNEFAEYVTINGKRVVAIFDTPDSSVTPGLQTVNDFTPKLTVQTKDIKSFITQGQQCIVRKTQYTIFDWSDDPSGLTVIDIREI